MAISTMNLASCAGSRGRLRMADLSGLDWRARHRAERAEHATVTGFGLQPCATALAVIEELAGIRGHRFVRSVTAGRADDRGF
jgi:hypothetical protein